MRASISCIPDPWPKKRHWKRRFVQDETVAKLARIIRPGGIFRFATDIPHYAAWTLERLLRAPDFTWTAEKADDWRLPWPEWVETRYEAKAKREGRTPAYFIFQRDQLGGSNSQFFRRIRWRGLRKYAKRLYSARPSVMDTLIDPIGF